MKKGFLGMVLVIWVFVGMGWAGAADTWTEISLATKLATATVDVTPTTATLDVDFATTGTYAIRSALLGGIEALGFDADDDQGAFFSIRVPNGASKIRPEVTCVATSGTVTVIGVVKWQIEYVVLSTTLGSTTSTLTNTSRSLGSKALETVPLGEMDVSGAVYVVGRLFRDADAAADTCAKTAYVIGFGYWRRE